MTTPEGLEIRATKSVNPEDLTEGGQLMSPSFDETTTEAPPLTSVAGLEHLFRDDETVDE